MEASPKGQDDSDSPDLPDIKPEGGDHGESTDWALPGLDTLNFCSYFMNLDISFFIYENDRFEKVTFQDSSQA